MLLTEGWRQHTLEPNTLTHWSLAGIYGSNIKSTISNLLYRMIAWALVKSLSVNAIEAHQWEVNIGLGNGLVPSGSKPLPEPMLIYIYVAI